MERSIQEAVEATFRQLGWGPGDGGARADLQAGPGGAVTWAQAAPQHGGGSGPPGGGGEQSRGQRLWEAGGCKRSRAGVVAWPHASLDLSLVVTCPLNLSVLTGKVLTALRDCQSPQA